MGFHRRKQAGNKYDCLLFVFLGSTCLLAYLAAYAERGKIAPFAYAPQQLQPNLLTIESSRTIVLAIRIMHCLGHVLRSKHMFFRLFSVVNSITPFPIDILLELSPHLSFFALRIKFAYSKCRQTLKSIPQQRSFWVMKTRTNKRIGRARNLWCHCRGSDSL